VCVVPAVFTDSVTVTTSDTLLHDDTPVTKHSAELRDKLLSIMDVCGVGPNLIVVDPPSLSSCGMILSQYLLTVRLRVLTKCKSLFLKSVCVKPKCDFSGHRMLERFISVG
jgi:hypothetical protein